MESSRVRRLTCIVVSYSVSRNIKESIPQPPAPFPTAYGDLLLSKDADVSADLVRRPHLHYLQISSLDLFLLPRYSGLKGGC